MSDSKHSAWMSAMPAVFVLIWSTGFISARYGMPYSPALSFLAMRCFVSALCFALWVSLARVAWPQERAQWGHLMVSGILLHAGYLSGVWLAIKGGMGAGLAALIVGLQPILTGLWAGFIARDTTVSARQWLGLVLGFSGLVLVVWGKLGVGLEVTPYTLGCTVMALLSITAGTLYQKRFVKPCDVRPGSAIQLFGAFVVCLPFAGLDQEAMNWQPQLVLSMLWAIFILSLGGSSLFYMLIQRGAATSVTSLLYLVPPTTAVIAWVLFGETITLITLAGTALTALAVWLVVRPSPIAARP